GRATAHPAAISPGTRRLPGGRAHPRFRRRARAGGAGQRRWRGAARRDRGRFARAIASGRTRFEPTARIHRRTIFVLFQYGERQLGDGSAAAEIERSSDMAWKQIVGNLAAILTITAFAAGGSVAFAARQADRDRQSVVFTLDPSTHGNPEGIAY